MRVIEIIIDGFKSYAARTVISGWDESFNAITGLNGSGKSNILESICFVLGITNMSIVRAQNSQDLIYKGGQAGVTKASVTIVFDNGDKNQSPIGFEEYATISVTRQITLGSTSKYLINGHRAQQQTVHNLFQSVQLNINNPNFLIMQGKITKVLNMKSMEILAMIQEAAGTKMFEDRKDKAFRTMAKKEMKLQELQELLKDEIEPKLERLRNEKSTFLEFQQIQNDLERLTRVVVAYDYSKRQERSEPLSIELECKKKQRQSLQDSVEHLRGEIAYLEDDTRRVQLQHGKELSKRAKGQGLAEIVRKHANDLVRLDTVIELKKLSLDDEREKELAARKTVIESEAALKDKTVIFDNIKATYDKTKKDLTKQSQDIESREELLQSLQTGVNSTISLGNSYQVQLRDAKNRATIAATEQEKAKLKIEHLQSRAREEAPRAQKATEHINDLLGSVNILKEEAQKLEKDLARVEVAPGKYQEMAEQELLLLKTLRDCSQKSDELKRQVAHINFSYADPTPGFDRSKVKGLVAQLFTLDKEHSEAGKALETCAGGRLFNVVVDSDVTGTQLLQKGKLRKRVTIIPLNRIAALKASAETVATAQTIAPGKVNLALSFVDYDNEIATAMEYVFGNTLICADAEIAKRVTFDADVKMRSITLQGDAYDPSGTLSGGSSPNSSCVLTTLQELNNLASQFTKAEQSLNELRVKIAEGRPKVDQARRIEQALAVKMHGIRLAEEQIRTNSSSTIIRAVGDMNAAIQQLHEDILEAKSRQAEANSDIWQIEKDMNDFNDNEVAKLAELQEMLEKLQSEHKKSLLDVRNLQKELQKANLDLEQTDSDLSAAREQLQEAELNIKKEEQEVENLSKDRTRLNDTHNTFQAQVDFEDARSNFFENELQNLDNISRSKKARIAEESLKMQQLIHQIEKLHNEQQGVASDLRQMDAEYDWILDERDKFGLTGTPYDFDRQNIGESKAKLRALAQRLQGMKRRVNPKVMNTLESVEKKEAALKLMIKTVIRDKKKIEETIASLDDYKKKTLHHTWEKVSRDCGQIFSELLPGGNSAQLDPPEGKTINDGLEFKVCLGNVWKANLMELSGGQRSLVALSLILALLEFKPAPLYILDEVDAALDPAHTQNIGRLIKTRFKSSQFIVVSLKDGMFQNANTIFRTRFSEGTSVVQTFKSAAC
ncbi:structural maintenance protein [Fusarium oxysporum]|nr:structural maintenance protein [Fusarium oxysporum]